MGKKTKKRKAFNNEFDIAAIEDEMAAVAEAYGLSIEEDVQKKVQQRHTLKGKKRKIRNQHGNQSQIELKPNNLPTLSKKSSISLMKSILPSSSCFSNCIVPDCKCSIRNLEQFTKTNQDERESIKNLTCTYCNHGILQHKIEVKDSLDLKSIMEVRLLYEWIILGRVASGAYQANVWIQQTLHSLLNIIDKLKKKYIQSGEKKHDKEMDTRHQFHGILIELRSLLVSCSQISHAIQRQENYIRILMYFDKMYFGLYYYVLTQYGRNSMFMASPSQYFQMIHDYYPDFHNIINEFYKNEIQDEKKCISLKTSPFYDIGIEKNPLHEIFQWRFYETIYFFYKENFGMNGEMEKAIQTSYATHFQQPNKKKTKKGMKNKKLKKSEKKNELIPPPCYPLLQSWRDICRDWCCHLFSYATPNNDAIQLISKYQPLIEIGAGTGYWCSILQANGIQITAYDKIPTEITLNKGQNEFHGRVPMFCEVLKGGSEILAKYKNSNLFLCYPPPNDPMARDCLRNFEGQYIIHVGEWNGDTGDRQFEHQLSSKFRLHERCSIPNWGNTAYELTIWKRHDEKANQKTPTKPILSCSTCHNTNIESLHRCRLCRMYMYCSNECYRESIPEHDQEHSLRMIFLKNSLSLDNPAHFEQLHHSKEIISTDFVSRTSWKDVLKPLTSNNNSTTSEFKFLND